MASAALDYYTVLEIEPSADDTTIAQSYLRLAPQYEIDPDRPAESSEAEWARKEQAELLARAYFTLGDPAKRQEYDALLSMVGRYADNASSRPRGHRHGRQTAPPERSVAELVEHLDHLHEAEVKYLQRLMVCRGRCDKERAKIIRSQDALEEQERASAQAAEEEEALQKTWQAKLGAKKKELTTNAARRQLLDQEEGNLRALLGKREEKLVALEDKIAVLQADVDACCKKQAEARTALEEAEAWYGEPFRRRRKFAEANVARHVMEPRRAEPARRRAPEQARDRQAGEEDDQTGVTPRRQPRPPWFDDKNWIIWQQTAKALLYYHPEDEEGEAPRNSRHYNGQRARGRGRYGSGRNDDDDDDDDEDIYNYSG